jgi:hypothetical protein
MVVLQQELVKIGSDSEPSLLIYPMLSAVKQGCTREDLIKAMYAAKSDVDKLDLMREEMMEEEEQAEMETENETDGVKITKFLEVMTKSYPIELAVCFSSPNPKLMKAQAFLDLSHNNLTCHCENKTHPSVTSLV